MLSLTCFFFFALHFIGKKQPAIEEQDPTDNENPLSSEESKTVNRVKNNTGNEEKDSVYPESPSVSPPEKSEMEDPSASSEQPVDNEYQTPPTDQPMHQEL